MLSDRWQLRAAERLHEGAAGRELRDLVVVAGDVDVARGIRRHAGREAQLAAPELRQIVATGVEFLDPVVVAVGPMRDQGVYTEVTVR